MKKAGIVTIVDYDNYGNRLQNYAVQEVLRERNFEVETIINRTQYLYERNLKKRILKKIKIYTNKILGKKSEKENIERKAAFMRFTNQNIKETSYKIDNQNITKYQNDLNKFDYIVIGSDQIWNPEFRRGSDLDFGLLNKEATKISFSASFGISEINKKARDKFTKGINNIDYLSVRESAGQKIIKDLTDRDSKVLVDPTMMLNVDKWERSMIKPEKLGNRKYILNYFLGELSKEKKCEIERIAKENDCDIINILDKNDIFYSSGPSEFLYLEKNAFLICTDSFHSCIFAILFDRPFVIFSRDDKVRSMNSRIETLLLKFGLEDRKYEGSINEKLLNHNYSNAYIELEKERKIANKFLDNALSNNKEGIK